MYLFGMVTSFTSLLGSYWFGADKQGSDEEVFPMCGVFPFATRTQPVKHEGYVKVSQFFCHAHLAADFL